MNKEVDISKVVIKTPRIILRAFRQEDLEDFHEYASVEGVGERAGWTHHQSMEDTQEVLNRFIEKKRVFAITYEGKVIGSIGIELYNEEKHPELDSYVGRSIGFVLSKDYWDRGIMTECCKAVIDYCFRELQVDFLLCAHFSDNYRSARVQAKCGFKYYRTGYRDDGIISIINILWREDYLK